VRKRAVEEHACKLAVGDFRQELLDEHLRGRRARHRPRQRAGLAAARDTLDAEAAGADERLDHRVVKAERPHRRCHRARLGDRRPRPGHRRAALCEVDHGRLREVPADQ